MPQTNYTFPDGLARAGMLASARDAIHAVVTSKLFSKALDVWTATVGGATANGVYSFTVDGATVDFDRQAAEDDTDIAAELVLDGEAETGLDNVAAFTSATTVVTITGLHHGDVLEVANSVAPAGATLVLDHTVDADKADLPVGVFVGRSSVAGQIRPLVSTDTDADIVGVSLVGEAALKDNTGDPADVDAFAPGTMVSVCVKCEEIWMLTEDEAAEGGSVHARIVASGAEVVGAVRATSDGVKQVTTATPTADDNAHFAVQIYFSAGPAKGETHTIAMTSDGTGTATEICDGLRTSLNSNARLAALLTDTGTATLILTSTDQESIFEVESVGALGVFASITTGTAGAPDTVTVQGAKFASSAGAGGLVKVSLNRQ